MADIDRDWIQKQLSKGIAAEESLIRAEKDHRSLDVPDTADTYDQIIRDDEKHLDVMKAIATRYGRSEGGSMESAGGLLGSLKSTMEGVMAADPFQSIGDDLMLKSNAINYDQVWADIFHSIGDEESAADMEQAATEDKGHRRLMLSLLSRAGLMEARGEKLEKRRAA